MDPMADKYSSLSPYNYSFNMPNTVVDVNGADPYQTVNASATTSPYYIMYTYDDRIDPTGLGAQTICAQCWREGNADAMAFYGAAMGRGFGMSMSFGALPYSAAVRAYAAQMRSDAYGLSAQAYGARYGTRISIPQAMAMQAEYNRWVYSQSYDLQMGVSMELFRQQNAIPSLSAPSYSMEDLIVTYYRSGSFSLGAGPMFQPQTFPLFSLLWQKYPHDLTGPNGEIIHQTPSKDGYEHQCAIRLSKCLIDSGVDMSTYTDPVTSEGWARGSSSLRWWLQSTFGRPSIIDQDIFEKDYINKTGIMYEAPVPGDIGHIDLWNKGDTGSGYYVASKIWFWEIK